MASGFLPNTDDGLLSFASNFSARITATPVVYGLVAVQATAYAAAFADYQAKLQTAKNPITRTKPTITAKDTSRDALRTITRQFAKIVDATVTVTDAQRVELGLNVRKTPSSIPAPTDRPGVGLVSVAGRTVSIDIRDTAASTKRGKPYGALAAWVYSYVGTDYPTDPSEWDFQGATTRSSFDIEFPDDVENGTQVWICAAWINAKQEAGPISVPLTTNVQGGGMSRAQKKNTQGVKLAA